MSARDWEALEGMFQQSAAAAEPLSCDRSRLHWRFAAKCAARWAVSVTTSSTSCST